MVAHRGLVVQSVGGEQKDNRHEAANDTYGEKEIENFHSCDNDLVFEIRFVEFNLCVIIEAD